jgi:hypothetical protein
MSHIFILQFQAFAVFRTLLEIFHVKHFCPIAAQNLTSRETASPLRFGKTGKKFGAIEIERRQLPFGAERCYNVSSLYDRMLRTRALMRQRLSCFDLLGVLGRLFLGLAVIESGI